MIKDCKIEFRMEGGSIGSITVYTLEAKMDSPNATITLIRDGEPVMPTRTLPNAEAIKSFGRTLGLLTTEMANGTLTFD